MPEPTQRERVTRQRPSPLRGAQPAQPPERQPELSEQLARATAENAALREENERQKNELKLLREKVDALIQRLFGAQSERIAPAQLLLMLQGLDDRPKAEEPVEVESRRAGIDGSIAFT